MIKQHSKYTTMENAFLQIITQRKTHDKQTEIQKFFASFPNKTNKISNRETPNKTTSSKVNLISKIPIFHSNIRSEYFLDVHVNAQ